ncbi:MAG: DeoR family transcriptional regulator [Lachnospiraceae bacterium]|nr:DeoR family transcriptional regulator [Lachnospiraceae bacterium]
MKDNAFQRRRDIERMLLSGKKLTTSQMMKMFGVGKNAIRRDFDIIGEELPVVTRQGYDGGYFLVDGVGQHQNSLTQEQLECLEKVAVTCDSEDRKIVLSIIHEFGPYCESFT